MAQPPILLMPLELRNQIYSYVYDCKYATPVTTRENGSRLFWTDHFYESITLTLLLVNRQISEEAAAIFYSKTNFKGNMDLILSFIKGIGATKANLLTQIEICHWAPSPKPDLFRQLLPLKGLKVLRLVQPCKGNIEAFKQEFANAGILEPTGRIDIEIRMMWTNCPADDRLNAHNICVWNWKKGEAEWKEERRRIPCLDTYSWVFCLT